MTRPPEPVESGPPDQPVRAPVRVRGRPRDERVTRAITDAALRQLLDEGYTRLSMESVASEAGVARTTVYRRFKDKADLVTAAIAAYSGPGVAPGGLGAEAGGVEAGGVEAGPAGSAAAGEVGPGRVGQDGEVARGGAGPAVASRPGVGASGSGLPGMGSSGVCPEGPAWANWAAGHSADPRADLERFLLDFDDRFNRSCIEVLGGLLADREDPTALALHRERVIEPRRAYARALLEQARDAGELAAGADLDLALDMLIGVVIARAVGGRDLEAGWARRALDLVWRGAATSARPGYASVSAGR